MGELDVYVTPLRFLDAAFPADDRYEVRGGVYLDSGNSRYFGSTLHEVRMFINKNLFIN